LLDVVAGEEPVWESDAGGGWQVAGGGVLHCKDPGAHRGDGDGGGQQSHHRGLRGLHHTPRGYFSSEVMRMGRILEIPNRTGHRQGQATGRQ